MIIPVLLISMFAGYQGPYRPLLPSAPPMVFALQDVLQQHSLWLRSNGTEGARADLRGKSLEFAGSDVLVGSTVLNGVDLRRADFRGAKMRNVDFTGADLQVARFDQANLRWAVLANTDLRFATFISANLQSANLRGANLNLVSFVNADLTGADLTGARCVTIAQLALAKTDEQTKLPTFEDCVPSRD
jgi:uncharacterized protein YjbI with pentapeptide repeats